MAEKHGDELPSGQDVLQLMDEARGRIRMAIWALHGMHQDLSALTTDDLTDLEQLLTEALEGALVPAYEAVAELAGGIGDKAVTTH